MIRLRVLHIGLSPSGKATDFDSVTREFESRQPSHSKKTKKIFGQRTARLGAVFCCLFLHPAKTLGLCGGIAMFSPFCPSFCPLLTSHKGHFLTPHSPACPAAWLSPFWSLFQRGHRHSWLYECQRAPAALVHPWRLPPPPLYLIFQTIQMGGNAHGHTIRAQKNVNGSVESWLKKRCCGPAAWMKFRLNGFAFGTGLADLAANIIV